MRKLQTYLRFFWLSIFLVLLGVLVWFYLQDSFNSFRGSFLGSLIGIGISISVIENLKKLTEYKRVKKTFGLLELITIPYLKNQADNLSATMKLYHDMCSTEQAAQFFAITAGMDKTAVNFDKSWLQLVYSQDFIDAINNDDHFNKIANAILEVLLFIKQLSVQSVNAQVFLLNNISSLTEEQKKNYLERARQIRDNLADSAEKLHKYTEKLGEEVSRFLDASGASYSEFER